jgi:hypothetical protein
LSILTSIDIRGILMGIDKRADDDPRKGDQPIMFALSAGVWPVNREDPTEIRDRYHRVAMHEAQVAADAREPAARPSGRSLADRVRLAIGLAPSEPQCIACGA